MYVFSGFSDRQQLTDRMEDVLISIQRNGVALKGMTFFMLHVIKIKETLDYTVCVIRNCTRKV